MIYVKMYSVTVFNAVDSEAEEEVEAHPSIWLSPGIKHCRWPTFKQSEAVKNAIRKRLEPRESWTTHDVKKVLYVCGKLSWMSNFIVLLFASPVSSLDT